MRFGDGGTTCVYMSGLCVTGNNGGTGTVTVHKLKTQNLHVHTECPSKEPRLHSQQIGPSAVNCQVFYANQRWLSTTTRGAFWYEAD